MVKIYYPTFEPFLNTSPVVYDYLMHGFKQLGHEVIISKYLDKECQNFVNPNDAHHITAFDIGINNKKIRVYYDWSDFKHYLHSFPTRRSSDHRKSVV